MVKIAAAGVVLMASLAAAATLGAQEMPGSRKLTIQNATGGTLKISIHPVASDYTQASISISPANLAQKQAERQAALEAKGMDKDEAKRKAEKEAMAQIWILVKPTDKATLSASVESWTVLFPAPPPGASSKLTQFTVDLTRDLPAMTDAWNRCFFEYADLDTTKYAISGATALNIDRGKDKITKRQLDWVPEYDPAKRVLVIR